jgi:hypothetical protein
MLHCAMESIPPHPRHPWSYHTLVLRSITMPTKNFFLSSSLTPTRSSHYPLLYSTHKGPLSDYSSGMTLNCHHEPSGPATGILLNCNLTQASHDMPSGHVGHLGHLGLLGHWTYSGMPSGPYVILGHLRQLRHPGHLGHLSHLSNISDLDPLNPSPLNPAPTDSLLGAFITEMDPTDPGLSEGCYADNSLNPFIQNHH